MLATSPDVEIVLRLLGGGGDYGDVARGVVEAARTVFGAPVAWLAATSADDPGR